MQIRIIRKVLDFTQKVSPTLPRLHACQISEKPLDALKVTNSCHAFQPTYE